MLYSDSLLRTSSPKTTLLYLIFSLAPWMLFAQIENCTNGIDDDGNGLIDCYDPECTCTGPCADFFYNTCDADCYFVPPCNNISLGIQWTGESEVGTYSVLVAGDMDKDGIPEIITYRVEKPDIYIINGATGATKVHIVGPTDYPGGTAPALADLDHDGFGEFVLVGNDRMLRCWEHDGTLKFTSTVPVGYDLRYRFSVPNIADFDGNGWAEINIGNQVFNGQTGALLAEGGANVSAGEHPARRSGGFSFCSTVPVDALPTGFCPDCDGLEIVAGNQVLSVNLTTGAVTPVVSAPSAYSDGFTSVADFDRDGDLEAIVQGKKGTLNYAYVWEIESPAVTREFQLYNNWFDGASRINVADMNGDGNLEVSFVGYPWLYALKNDFTPLWTRPVDDVSSVTCSSIFDFCGDGTADVVYRDEFKLQVIEGATGQTKWSDNCASATHIEAPLILDVDNDGQTEVVITCGTNGSRDFGHVTAYEAIGTPGIASRKVWNQHAYFNVNINDDLSVPAHQQNPHIVGDGLKLNNFLNQYFNPTFPAPDGSLSIQGFTCEEDSFAVTMRVCNLGDNFLPSVTPVSIYKKNPQTTSAQFIGSFPIGSEIKPDSCKTFVYHIPRIANDSVFLVLNDDHSRLTPYDLENDFPVTNIGECSFKNNIVGLYYSYQPDMLAIGNDTIICDNAKVNIDANGQDYLTWAWQDGTASPTLLATEPGIYAVTITDVCGITQTDTRSILLDSSTVVTLGSDRSMCKGETFIIGESGFDYYLWKPAISVDNNTSAMVVAAPSSSGNLVLEAGFSNGCKSYDTIFVAVYDTFNLKIDTTICFGRTVMWNGEEILPDASKTFFLQTEHGCDSTVQVRVHGTTVGTYNFTVDTAVCLGSQLDYGNMMHEPNSAFTFYLSALTGCDSTVMLQVGAKDTFATNETIIVCADETVTVFGQNMTTSGIFAKRFTAKNGCDSTHTVNLTILPEIQMAVDGTPTCLNENTGTLNVMASGGAPPFQYFWSIPDKNTQKVEALSAGNYSVTVTDTNDCAKSATGTVPAYPEIVFAVETDSVRCYGQNNGVIRLSSANPSLTYSLDGETWVQYDTLPNLEAGQYEVWAQDEYGCVISQPAPVYQPNELTVLLPESTSIYLGDSLALPIISNSTTPLQYRWQNTLYLDCPTCPEPIAKPWHTIRYVLTATDANGCKAGDDILITVERVIGIYVPNVFSPDANEDQNARFAPAFGPAIKQMKSFRIFNRWGAMVFESGAATPNDPNIAWDGEWKSKKAPSGVYAWTMEVELVDGNTEKYQGNVTIMR